MTRMTTFEEMDRLFDALRRSMTEGGSGAARGTGFGDARTRMEADDDAYVVHADLPGFETDEIDLRFEEGTLAIEAVHESADESLQTSRRFREELRIPGEVVIEGIAATYNNGVLEVRLPVASGPEESGHRIEIE